MFIINILNNFVTISTTVLINYIIVVTQNY